jgi:hypothetical protein
MKLYDWLRATLRGEPTKTLPGGQAFHGLRVSDALKAHEEWLRRFKAALAQKQDGIDPEAVAHNDRCTLGQWIAAQRAGHASLAQSSAFEQLDTMHTTFHRTASLLAHAIQNRERAEARVLLDLMQSKSRMIQLSLAQLLIEAEESTIRRF